MTAFLLTWKETGWPHENIVRMVRTLGERGFVDEPWRVAAHKMAKAGDRVWVLKQGPGPKGIFGAGHIMGKAELSDAGNGKLQMTAPVRFETFVDPRHNLLIGAEAVAGILRPTQVRAQSSGLPVDDEQSAKLEKLLPASPGSELGGAGDWKQTELHAIVADYFVMLGKEFKHESYSKTGHRNALLQSVQRSPGAIERKHQNISAVLQNLGLPWINGYKPLGNFQDALVDVIEAQLGRNIERFDQAALPPPTASTTELSAIFVAPPSLASHRVRRRSISRVIRKFDPAARDEANHRLGKEGEQLVLHVERHRLKKVGRSDLAEKVRWVAQEIGDGFGYDIESFADDGSPIFIEVKTTRGPIDTPFFLSENERCIAAEKGSAFRLYRLFDFGGDPRIYELTGPLERDLTLEPITYRVWVGLT